MVALPPLLLPSLLVACAASRAAGASSSAPDLLWLTSPTLPSQTLVAIFTSASPNATAASTATVRLCHGATLPTAPAARCAGTQTEPAVQAGDGLSVMVAVPTSWPLAVYAAQLCQAGACSRWSAINNADPLWAQADRGLVATRGPTGWLRILGRSLAFSSSRCVDTEAVAASTASSVRLVDSSGASIHLTSLARGSCYDLAVPVPGTVPLGRYIVQVKNSLPGSSWVPTSDGQHITVVAPELPAANKFRPAGQTGKDVAAALAAAAAAGGGTVELAPNTVYHMAVNDSLFIPDGVTLTTAGSRGEITASTTRGMLLWEAAAPRSSQVYEGYCRGAGEEAGIWHGNLSARLAECPPLLWGNGTFVVSHIHARAPALSALVELVEPSVGAVIRDSILEVIGYEIDAESRNRTYVNVSNALHIGNCSGFTVENNELRHVAEGAIAYGGQYGGHDTPAPCGANSPDNYAFFFDQGVEYGLVRGNNVTMGCNGWGTQSHSSLLLEWNHFRSVGLSGVEGSGFSSASTVPRATQAAFLRNTIHGTNAATGPHLTEWCNTTHQGLSGNGWCNRTGWGPKANPGNPVETMTSDGSYGGYFGHATVDAADMSQILLHADITPNKEGEAGSDGNAAALSPDQRAGGVHSWRHGAMVVVQGAGLGQVRTVVGGVPTSPLRGVQLDRPLTTALGPDSIITIAPNVGRWIVAGNAFSNGTSVQTYGITLQAIFANNSFENMTRSGQVDPAGLCLTSGGYGTGTMPNMYFEITGNRQRYSEGIHIRCGEVNNTALTYGFAIRDNTFEDPPPDAYFGDARYPDSGIGLESGGQVTVASSCTAGLVEGNMLEDRRPNASSQAIKIDPSARAILSNHNRVVATGPRAKYYVGPGTLGPRP